MPRTLVIKHENISGSEFEDVNMSDTRFTNIRLAGAKFEDVNLSGAVLHAIDFRGSHVSAAQFGGATFQVLGVLPGPDGAPRRPRAVTFEDCMFPDSVFRRVNLENAAMEHCTTTGMTIDGVSVDAMLAAWRSAHPD